MMGHWLRRVAFRPMSRRFMTICIAALAERSKAIVMVADKAITYGSAAPMQAETTARKIVPVGDSGWYTLMAGDTTFAGDVIEKGKNLIAAHAGIQDSVSGMMRCMKEAYQRCKETEIEGTILRPNLLTKTLIIARPATLLPLQSNLNDKISKAIAEHNCETDLLICGFDKDKHPHIFSIRDPGVYENHDLIGYHAVGIGQEAAMARLMSVEADKADPLAKALYGAFDAKVNAEVIQSIGYGWDAEILTSTSRKSVRVPRPIISLIDRVYNGFPRSPFDVTGAVPDRWWVQLHKFCKRVMPKTKMPPVSTIRRPKGKK